MRSVYSRYIGRIVCIHRYRSEFPGEGFIQSSDDLALVQHPYLINSTIAGVHESIESSWNRLEIERTIEWRGDSLRFMGEGARVNVAVADGILLHLLNHISQADLHTVTPEITRRGISLACAVHPPNVSRSMRDLWHLALLHKECAQ